MAFLWAALAVDAFVTVPAEPLLPRAIADDAFWLALGSGPAKVAAASAARCCGVRPASSAHLSRK